MPPLHPGPFFLHNHHRLWWLRVARAPQLSLPVRQQQQVFKYRIRTRDSKAVPLLPRVTETYNITVPGSSAGSWRVAYYR